MKVGELVLNVAIKGAGEAAKGLKKIKANVGVISKKFLKLSAIVSGLVLAFKAISSGFSSGAVSLYDFSKETGLSTKTLQRWQFAGKKVGATAGEIQSNITGLSKALAQQHMGKSGVEGFGRLMAFTNIDKNRMNDTFYILRENFKKL